MNSVQVQYHLQCGRIFMVKGASSLSDFRIVTSQSKHKRFLSAFATVNLIFCLFGLTRISLCPLKFKCLQSCCRIDLSAVAVSPKTGLLPKKERKTLIRPNACRKAAFPFFPVPLLKQLRQKFSNKKQQLRFLYLYMWRDLLNSLQPFI